MRSDPNNKLQVFKLNVDDLLVQLVLGRPTDQLKREWCCSDVLSCKSWCANCQHRSSVVDWCFWIMPLRYQMRQHCVVQWSLTKDALRSLVQACMHCQLDYCNAVLALTADILVKWLLAVQNTVARLMSWERLQDHNSTSRSLRWLPLWRRIVSNVRLVPILGWRLAGWKWSSSVAVCINWISTCQSFAFYGSIAWNCRRSALRDVQ